MKTTQEKIDCIMDWFNFAKVEKAMTALNWTWTDGVPNEPELRQLARRLLKDISAKNVTQSEFRRYIATGGFRATKYYDGELELEFILSGWESAYNK